MITVIRTLAGCIVAALGLGGAFFALFTWGPGIGVAVLILGQGIAAILIPSIDQ